MTRFEAPPELRDVRWLRVRFTLRNERVVPQQKAHPLSVFDAILRAPNKALGLTGVFHMRNRHWYSQRLKEGARFDLKVLLNIDDLARGQEWVAALRQELAREPSNFALVDTPVVELRAPQAWEDEPPPEVCLEFLTPFAFRPRSAARGESTQATKPLPTALDAQEFAQQLRDRLRKVFAIDIDCCALLQGVELLPYFWRFTNISHESSSQPGQVKWIKGCVGPLYLRGALGPLLPLLLLCAEVHLGGAMAFGQGYFRLHTAPRPLFGDGFPRQDQLVAATQNLLDTSDTALAEASARYGQPFDLEQFARSISEDLRSGRYAPKPATVHRIPKHDGSWREIEELDLVDRVVHGALLSALAPVFDIMFEPNSLGYRKGKSLDSVRARIGSALDAGYRYVLESDIDDFFPSVDHVHLREALQGVLPLADKALVDFLLASVCVPRLTDIGAEPRLRGLPQGSPISPLLANLYLDRFDEAFTGQALCLVRYADDFVILTRERSEAESAQSAAETKLAALGLHLKPAKTAIVDAREGFQFLGMWFGRDGPDAAPPVEHRRPLYVVEPGCFIGVNGEAVEVRAERMLKQVLPLRRISAIVLLNRAVLSTALIARCAALDVPITVTLESGYHLATWAPDRRQFFEIAARQVGHYDALGETARLAIAREIVRQKVNNGLAFLRQRYRAGDAEWSAKQQQYAAGIDTAQDTMALRGVEGNAAKHFFSRYAQEIDEPFFRFTKRARDNPDPINSLMNFGYYMLFSRISATLRALGLNPYLGFLHESGERFETLTCDVQELFRAHVDRLNLRVLGQKVIRPEHFHETARGLRMTGDAVRTYVLQFELEMARRPKSGGLCWSEAIYAQCRNVRYFFCERRDLTFYRFGE